MTKFTSMLLTAALGTVTLAGAAEFKGELEKLPTDPVTGCVAGPKGQLTPTLNKWVIRSPGNWKLVAKGERAPYLMMVKPDPSAWHLALARHELDIEETAVVSFDLAMSGAYTSAYVWLADSRGDGYALELVRGNLNGGHFKKFIDNKLSIGSPQTFACKGVDSPKKEFAHQKDNFFRFYFRLVQPAPDQPVKLSFWAENLADGTKIGSPEKPIAEAEDTGRDAFSGGKPVLNLNTLEYIGFSSYSPAALKGQAARIGNLSVVIPD